MQKGVIVAVVALLVAAAAAWFFLRPKPAAPPPAPAPQAQPKPADVPLPPAAESDAQVRKALLPVTKFPVWETWLDDGDLVNRWAVVADNLAEDVSPRKQLARAAPEGRFTVLEKKKGAPQIDPRNYQRYDLFTEVVASVDAKAFAKAARDLHPLLESAYHKLGYPDRRLDDVARKALQRLIDAPVVEGPIELVPKGAIYKFADQKLEALGPVEKHLVRMGPRNTRLIQSKAREIAAELFPR
jgi:hypothetical protein